MSKTNFILKLALSECILLSLLLISKRRKNIIWVLQVMNITRQSWEDRIRKKDAGLN